jgi:hypothetical protein
MDLKEWAINYVKHKDLVLKNLQSYQVKQNFIEFQFKDKVHDYYILEHLQATEIRELLGKNDSHLITVVCIHDNPNFDFLVKQWDELVVKNITFIFVDGEHHDKWIINPQIHSRIADKKSLKQGLKTMFDAAAGKIVAVVL